MRRQKQETGQNNVVHFAVIVLDLLRCYGRLCSCDDPQVHKALKEVDQTRTAQQHTVNKANSISELSHFMLTS